MPPKVSTLRLVALLIFIALVAVAVWLADLRLAVALLLVALAWLIAAVIEYVAWRSARGPVAVVEAGEPRAAAVSPSVPRAGPEPVVEEASPVEQTIVPAAPEPEPVAEAVEPEPVPPPERAPEPEPPAPEPEPPGPEPPALEPKPELESVVDEATPAPEPEHPAVEEQQSRWARRKRLRAVPTPEPDSAPAEPAPQAAETKVVSLPQSYVPRQWNIWDLERLARTDAQEHPERRDEWAFLFVNLRQFANAEGVLPTEFDSLVRESFGSLLERQPIR